MQKVRRVSPACKWGISGSISLLSFQLSFTVLIRYRYVIIFSFRCMGHLSSNNSTLVFGYGRVFILNPEGLLIRGFHNHDY